MSELQFPKDPIVGQEYDFAPYRYYWDGAKWKTKGIGYNPVNDLRDELEPRISDNEAKVFESLKRSYAAAGLTVKGYTKDGAILISTSDVVIHNQSGKGYSWGGVYPVGGYVVAPNTDPTLDVNFVDRSSELPQISMLTGAIRKGMHNATALELSDFISLREFADPSDPDNHDLMWQNAANFVNTSPLWVSGFGTPPTTLIIPSGETVITQDVTFTRGVHLKGLGGSLIRCSGDCGIIVSPATTATTYVDDIAITHVASTASSVKPLLHVTRNFKGRYSGNRFQGKQELGGRRYGLYSGSVEHWACQFLNNIFNYCDCGLRSGKSNDATHCSYIGNTISNNYVVGAIICNPKNGVFESNSVEWNSGQTGLAVTSKTSGSTHAGTGFGIGYNYILNNGSAYSGQETTVGLLVGRAIPGTTGWDAPDVLITSIQFNHGLHVHHNHIGSSYTGLGCDINQFLGAVVEYNEPVGSIADICVRGLGGVTMRGNRNPTTGSLVTQDYTTQGSGLMTAVYVNSATGVDTNPGTSALPVATWATAYGRCAANGTIYVQNDAVTASGVTIDKNIKVSVDFSGVFTVFNTVVATGVTLQVVGTGRVKLTGWRGFVQAAGSTVKIGDGIRIDLQSTDANACVCYMQGGCQCDFGNLGSYITNVATARIAMGVSGGVNIVGVSVQTTAVTSTMRVLADACKIVVMSVPTDIALAVANNGSAVRV